MQSQQIEVGLSFKEWAFLAASLGSFQNMLVDYLESRCTELSFPETLVSAIEADQDEFAETFTLVYNRLAEVAKDGCQPIPTTAKHDADVILMLLNFDEFAPLWLSWRALTQLLTQSAAGKPLQMPHSELPHTSEGIITFTKDLCAVLRKTPAVKMKQQISGQRPN